MARVFEGNLGNRLTEELANGMLQKLLSIIEEREGKPLEARPLDGEGTDDAGERAEL